MRWPGRSVIDEDQAHGRAEHAVAGVHNGRTRYCCRRSRRRLGSRTYSTPNGSISPARDAGPNNPETRWAGSMRSDPYLRVAQIGAPGRAVAWSRREGRRIELTLIDGRPPTLTRCSRYCLAAAASRATRTTTTTLNGRWAAAGLPIVPLIVVRPLAASRTRRGASWPLPSGRST
jgi:hypothetical protein